MTFCFSLGLLDFYCVTLCSSAHRGILLISNPAPHNCILNMFWLSQNTWFQWCCMSFFFSKE